MSKIALQKTEILSFLSVLKNKCILLILCLCVYYCNAQHYKTDSLRRLMVQSSDNKNKVNFRLEHRVKEHLVHKPTPVPVPA